MSLLFLDRGFGAWLCPSPLLLLALGVASSINSAAAAEPVAVDAERYRHEIQPLLVRHCQKCHSGEKPAGDFQLDQLPPDFAKDAHRQRWQAILARVQAGEMPPDTQPRLAANEARALATWIDSQTSAHAATRRAEGRVVLRRLNRTEYENTVRDLLGVEVDLKDLLPLDTSAGGFDNIGEALHTSSFLLERYLEAADAALNVAIANKPQPPLLKKRYSFKDERHVKNTTERVFRPLDDALVLFSSSPWQAVTLGQFYPAERGNYRFRISAYGVQSAGKPVTFRVQAGLMLMTGSTHLVGYFDAPPDQPTVVEFVDRIEPRNTLRLLPYGLASAQEVNKVGAETFTGPGLAVEWIEVEGPLHETWPPKSHQRIFGDLSQAPAPTYKQRDRVEVVSNNPRADAERILRNFSRRAFRRPVTDEELQPLVALVETKLSEKHSFEQAIRVGLTAVLVSPNFLFLREAPGPLDDFALASRLSYFLWSTMPDEELLTLAQEGKLSQPKTLQEQVERLLNEPKSQAFTQNFVGQWLGLRDIDFTAPSRLLYPEFDEMLKASMVRETELFFAEVLKDDLSLTNFIASDFTMLNGRLATHYGIAGVEGWEFRKTLLPPESHRGGLLTMASVLKVTANGTSTSPIIRGAWVLDRILGTPPQPPPENVAALEPDIRGAATIREQLAKHREVGACASCHKKIDPPGFALESFDVIGGWRDYYRTTGSGKTVIREGRRMSYHQGRPVDPADVLPDGRAFQNIDEFKQLLLADKDQLARALAIKLLAYATGGAPQSAEPAAIEAIVGKTRDNNYGFRSLVHAVV